MRHTTREIALFFAVLTILLSEFCPCAGAAEEKVEKSRFNPQNIEKRGDFLNSAAAFQKTGRGRVAFLGGSITEMDGYRPMLCEYINERFPKTEFEFIDAGISSTCSTTGAFRLVRDVLSRGPIDLFFVEFAVNDNQDGHFSRRESIRGMEGILRQLRTASPAADIVMTFFVNEPIMDACRAGTEADSILAHRQVAERYGVSSINLAREVTEEIDAGKLTWAEYGGVHPAPRGNRLCVEMIKSLLESDWTGPLAAETLQNRPKPYPLPEPLDRFSYFGGADSPARGGFLSPERAELGEGWSWSVPDWTTIPGALRGRFAGQKLLCASTPGAKCAVEFNGPVFGAYVLAGPDAGTLECRIDGGEAVRVDLFHDYSSGLHYPRTVIFADELADGPHRAEISVAAEKNEKSAGTAARILQFCSF